MASDKDLEQDELIRSNAEHIRRNEAAIQRQTECLEKIRDHYFPKQTIWKQLVGYFLKVVGAVAVYAGLMETMDWYLNTRKSEGMATESAQVAERLLLKENDPEGAVRFLEKAIELDDGEVQYRIKLAYVKGIAALVDYFELGRPFTTEERARVDSVVADALFLRQVAPDNAMPHILAAQAYKLRGDQEAAKASVDKAVQLAPEQAFVRVNACAVRFMLGDFKGARADLDAAWQLDPAMPVVLYWKGIVAKELDHKNDEALRHFDEMLKLAPRLALGHAARGWALMDSQQPDYEAARSSFRRALEILPKMQLARLRMSETYEREGKWLLARLWLDQVLERDPRNMNALTSRARVLGKLGEWRAAAEDLTKAIALAPFRADLYQERANAYEKSLKLLSAKEDRKIAEALAK